MEKEPTLSLTCLVVVEHDGVKFGPDQDAGDQLALTEAQARPLLAVGAVALTPPEPEPATSNATGGGKKK